MADDSTHGDLTDESELQHSWKFIIEGSRKCEASAEVHPPRTWPTDVIADRAAIQHYLEAFSKMVFIERWYRSVETDASLVSRVKKALPVIESIRTELCFNIGLECKLDAKEVEIVEFLLAETFETKKLTNISSLHLVFKKSVVLQVN